ncbi:hypothetical protein LWC35_08150 [Pseudonocardia kujensis]|uniref:hypothetical protein n=1 Tax=Pseudonocardia kujensis TaxID=1128675 RepID=UPI001E53516A|nr:hypothetical protein [Pseudonocardia kujensis]MCE0762884.1 hypothetical protein [Pseudonocardia kujensis]
MPDERSDDSSDHTDRIDHTGGPPPTARPHPPGPAHRAEDPLDRPSRRRATMPADQRVLLRRAALLAPERYPGPVGELLERELLLWEDFGHRFGAHALVSRLIAQILDPAATVTRDPGEHAAAAPGVEPTAPAPADDGTAA